MSLSDLDVRVTLQGDGANKDFALNFDFTNNTEITVYLRDETDQAAISETLQVLTTNYTLTGGPPVTTVNMNVAPTATQKVVIVRSNPKTQPTVIPGTGKFNTTTMEEDLDKLVRLVQENKDALDRCPKVRVTELGDGTLQVTAAELVSPQPKDLGVMLFKAAWEDGLQMLTINELVALANAQGLTVVAPGSGNANGLLIAAGGDINLHFATNTQPGIVSIAAQTFKGAKTFTDAMILNALLTLTEPPVFSSGVGITAFAGGGQGSATALIDFEFKSPPCFKFKIHN